MTCLNILKNLCIVLWGTPLYEPPQEEQQDPWYSRPQEDTKSQYLPQAAPQYPPRVTPQYPPRVTPHYPPQALPQYPPRTVPQYLPQTSPQFPPRAAPQSPPQAAPQYLPQSAPQLHGDLDELTIGSNRHEELRAQANAEGDQMNEAFKQSRQVQSRGDKAAAKNRAEEHRRKMKILNQAASERIFSENNKRTLPGEVDLHQLHVDEAISFTDRAIEEAMQRGERKLHLIVGKGLHSEGGVPKIKPAIQKHLQRHQLAAEPDPRNAGVLIVQLGSEGTESPLKSRM